MIAGIEMRLRKIHTLAVGGYIANHENYDAMMTILSDALLRIGMLERNEDECPYPYVRVGNVCVLPDEERLAVEN